jgi:hypothetical protein
MPLRQPALDASAKQNPHRGIHDARLAKKAGNSSRYLKSILMSLVVLLSKETLLISLKGLGYER